MLYFLSRPHDKQKLFEAAYVLLKEAYAPLGATVIASEKIAMECIRWGTRILSSTRLNSSVSFLNAITAARHEVFPYCYLVLPDKTCQLILPPILESYKTHKGEKAFLLLDGSHRCYAAQPSYQEISVLTVSFQFPPPPLPCRPLAFSEIEVQDSQPRLKELFADLSEEYFRPVRQLAHKRLRYTSLGAALAATGIEDALLEPLKIL